MSRRQWYATEKAAVCTALAGNSHQAGLLLHVIMQRHLYAKKTITGKDGAWSVESHAALSEACRLTRDCLKRALLSLERNDPPLIERAYAPFGGVLRALHIRPTDTAIDLVDAATTFRALNEIITDHPGPLTPLWELWTTLTKESITGKVAGVIARWYESLGEKQPYAAEIMKEAWGRQPKPDDPDDVQGKLQKAAHDHAISK